MESWHTVNGQDSGTVLTFQPPAFSTVCCSRDLCMPVLNVTCTCLLSTESNVADAKAPHSRLAAAGILSYRTLLTTRSSGVSRSCLEV